MHGDVKILCYITFNLHVYLQTWTVIQNPKIVFFPFYWISSDPETTDCDFLWLHDNFLTKDIGRSDIM